MSKRQHQSSPGRPREAVKSASAGRWWIAVVAALAVAGGVFALRRSGTSSAPENNVVFLSHATNAATAAAPPPPSPGSATTAVPTMEAAQSVVVTHDLDYGAARPSLAEIMKDIDRRHQADDGFGRTFAILEAFNGEVQPDGKIRVSLRISTEKPGAGEIVFRRTGGSLWKIRVTPATQKPALTGGALTLFFDDGAGKSFTVDGSTGPASIFAAILKESGQPVAEVWPEGAERELTFIYSACGCPVKVSCRRMGERTVRTKELSQVIFPDDPAAVQVIQRLMGW